MYSAQGNLIQSNYENFTNTFNSKRRTVQVIKPKIYTPRRNTSNNLLSNPINITDRVPKGNTELLGDSLPTLMSHLTNVGSFAFKASNMLDKLLKQLKDLIDKIADDIEKNTGLTIDNVLKTKSNEIKEIEKYLPKWGRILEVTISSIYNNIKPILEFFINDPQFSVLINVLLTDLEKIYKVFNGTDKNMFFEKKGELIKIDSVSLDKYIVNQIQNFLDKLKNNNFISNLDNNVLNNKFMSKIISFSKLVRDLKNETDSLNNYPEFNDSGRIFTNCS